MRVVYAILSALIICTCYSMALDKNEEVYPDNVYFTLKNDLSKWYLKSLAEDLLYMQGIQAEVTFA